MSDQASTPETRREKDLSVQAAAPRTTADARRQQWVQLFQEQMRRHGTGMVVIDDTRPIGGRSDRPSVPFLGVTHPAVGKTLLVHALMHDSGTPPAARVARRMRRPLDRGRSAIQANAASLGDH